MYLRRSAVVKYSVAALIGAVLYCEWLVYLIQPQFWNRFHCQDYDATCTKILFVADPQIQGNMAVPPPLNYLFNWDSDRYLKSSFSVVLSYFKPDVIVYLGDLMDEGSISTMPQFHAYAKRLANIFDIHYPVIQVWLPGDNDIGGENEPIRKDKIEEFEKVFKQPSVITHKNISFYKVNGITHRLPDKIEGTEDNLKIVVSHYAITAMPVLSQQVRNAIHPDIYFCAHEHESKYVKQDKDFKNRKVHRVNGNDVLTVPFDGETVYEIFVPSCSYRMGTRSIGYGAAILENNNQVLRYMVFWSSERFPYLFFYLAVLILLNLYIFIFCMAKLFLRYSRSTERSGDKALLLERS